MSLKALILVKQAYIKNIAYRSEILLWFVMDFIPIGVLLLVWSQIFSAGETIRGYSLHVILQYYFLTAIISWVCSTHFESFRVEEIRNGKIDYFLTRPLSYLQEILYRDVGGKLMSATIALPIYLCLFLILTRWFNLATFSITWWQASQFLALILGAYAIEFCLATIIVLLGFWFEGAEGLEHFKWITVALFSGSMIPLALMPPWLQTIVYYLPFKYMYSIPIGIIQNTTQLTVYDGLYLGAFISLLYLLIQLIWRQAKYVYASAGG